MCSLFFIRKGEEGSGAFASLSSPYPKRGEGKLKNLEKMEEFEKTRSKLRLPPKVKPCIIQLLNGASLGAKDGDNPFIIACELFRVGRNKKQIEMTLSRVGVREIKIRRAVKSALTGRYSFGCPTLEERGLCLYKSRFECWWHEEIPRKSQKSWRERDFWRYRWPKRLKPSEVVVYWGLKELEKKRRFIAGTTLWCTWHEIAELTGISHPTVGKALEKLKEVGLIHYSPGKRREKGLKSLQSTVQRIIPIPKSKKT